jgi:hypothetical protein
MAKRIRTELNGASLKISELERKAPIAVVRNFRLHRSTHGDKIAK